MYFALSYACILLYCTDIPATKWAVTIAEALKESEEHEEPLPKPEPVKRSVRKHPSFETWLEGFTP